MREAPGDEIGTDYATLKVAAAESGYKSIEPERGGGGIVGKVGSYASEADGAKGDAMKLTRRDFSKSLEDGDVTELTGYPRGRGLKEVRGCTTGESWPSSSTLVPTMAGFQDHYKTCEGF